MVMVCYVVGCKSRRRKTLSDDEDQDDVSFHKFPADKALNHKWMVAAGRVDSKGTKCPRMCSKHFTTDCFKELKNSNRKFLARDSVPTLNVYDASTVLANVNTENIKHNLNVSRIKRKLDVDAETNDEVDSDMEIIDEANSETCNLSEIEADAAEIEVIDEANSETSNLSEIEADAAEIEVIDEANSGTCNLSEIEADAAESNVNPDMETILVVDDTLPPETRKLIFNLQRKAQVAVSQKKTIRRLRSMVFRLRKKNEKLTAVIEIMKNESLRGHTGPSILLVGL